MDTRFSTDVSAISTGFAHIQTPAQYQCNRLIFSWFIRRRPGNDCTCSIIRIEFRRCSRQKREHFFCKIIINNLFICIINWVKYVIISIKSAQKAYFETNLTKNNAFGPCISVQTLIFCSTWNIHVGSSECQIVVSRETQLTAKSTRSSTKSQQIIYKLVSSTWNNADQTAKKTERNTAVKR